MKGKQILFSVTKDDLDIQTFRSGGKGGQHQNTTDSGVRIVHRASGAVGESRSERSQHQNKKIAFRHLVASPVFKSWLKINVAAKMKGVEDIEKEIDEMMKPENLKIEVL
jgi:protein subunit release factor B